MTKSVTKKVAKKRGIIALIVICCVVGAICAGLAYANYHYSDRIPPGTYITGIKVSGMTVAEAQVVAENVSSGIVMDIDLVNDSGVTSVPAITKNITAKDFGVNFDAAETAKAALDADDEGFFLSRLNPFERKDIGLSVSIDVSDMESKLHSYFDSAVFEPESPGVNYDKKAKAFTVKPGVTGTQLGIDKFIEAVKNGEFVPGEAQYDLHVTARPPAITDEAANAAAEAAGKISKTKLHFLKNDEVAFKVAQSVKATWITFTEDEAGGKIDLGIKNSKVAKYLKDTVSKDLVIGPKPALVVKEVDIESIIEGDDNADGDNASADDDPDAANLQVSALENDDEEDNGDDEVSGDSGDGDSAMASRVHADVSAAENGNFSGIAPKEARLVRDGEVGLAIANMDGLAEEIAKGMLANESMSLTPEYETVPFETEEIDDSYGKWIETDLPNQTTYLWFGNKKIKTFRISSGKSLTPTIPGTYHVELKRALHDMKGYDPVKKKKYTQPNVRWILYYDGAYAYHAAYWHNAFGSPASHGCINMKTEEAEYTFNFAPIGTLTIIH